MARLDTHQATRRAQRRSHLAAASSAADPGFVASAARGLAVLQAFDAEAPELGNAQIAERAGLPKSTVSRLTYTLASLGWLTLAPGEQRYRLGPAAATLAHAFAAGRALRERARPHMEALALRFHAPVALAERDGLEMLYLEYARGDAAVIVPRTIGSRVPLAPSASGRAWLASAHPAEAQAVREQLQAQPGRPWKGLQAALEQAAQDLRRLGFTRSYGDMQPEVNSVAVPMRSPVDGALVVFNLAAPAALVPERRFDTELGPALVRMVGEVRREMAGDA